VQENVDTLIDCVKENIGFSNGKPIAAFTIYKCLLHWKCFESEKTSAFDRLIEMIGSAIEVNWGAFCAIMKILICPKMRILMYVL
jgi:hypothetical protein